MLEKLRHWLTIEWNYDALPSASTSQEISNHFPYKATLPNQEIIDELIFLTNIGHLTAIKKCLSDLEQDKSIDQQFIQQMKEFARDVQLEKMGRTLRNTL